MSFLLMELIVVIFSWNVSACNHLFLIHLILFLICLLPFSQLLRNSYFLYVVYVIWVAVLLWGQVELAMNYRTCSELILVWTLVILVVFLYLPMVVLFVFMCSMMIRVCREVVRMATLKTYKAHEKKRPENECCICQVEYQNNDQLTQLPCSHEFHTQCIEPWIRDHSCPVCRASLL